MLCAHGVLRYSGDNKERVYGNSPLIATWTNRSCRWIKMCQFPFLCMPSPFIMENGPSLLPQGFICAEKRVLENMNAALSRHS